jgi:hypothetical protein
MPRLTAPARTTRAAAGQARRRLLTWRYTPSIESRLVWVLGSPRSGSTWLLRMLAEHEAVVPINEPLIGWYLGPFLTDLPGWSASGLDHSNFTLRKVQAKKRDQFFADEFSDVVQPALAAMIRRRFAAHLAHYPPRGTSTRARIVIKEPNGSQSADVLLGALPKSSLLFLLRDGRDVVDSELSANLKGGWISAQFPGGSGISDSQRLDFVARSAQRWLWRTETVEEAYDSHPGPTRMVKYEDLLTDPAAHLRAILEWLDLPLEQPELVAILEKHEFDRLPVESRGKDKFFRAASPGLWQTNLTPEEQSTVHEILGEKLQALGYEAG